MHLKSLTLKGFKSFAQATTFAFEPGVTAIVGPNGSGKSNVVDALAWVMGEQGAKTLRGGTMADVIFAGTATRGPLGRAEVVLTIDNGDGALPIEYAEVAISRTLFRNGTSEYAINGDSCRLLDVQELLSDSGLGREMHVIVGQGQLDAVLRATPEERRGFIEEAAGILKHRRRKERTVRKLESMQANLARLTDLADELRRQLKPLGAQAEVAREAATIQATVRDARIRLLAADTTKLVTSIAALEETRDAGHLERQVAADQAQRLGKRAAELEASEVTAELDQARRTALDLERVQERFRSLAQLAATRIALLGPEEAPVAAPSTAADDLARLAEELQRLEQDLVVAEARHEGAGRQQQAAQRELDVVDRQVAAGAAAVGAHERRLTELAARLSTAESRLTAAQADLDRRTAAAEAAAARRAAAVDALAAAPEPVGEAPEEQAAADTAVEDATARHEDRRAALHDLERRSSAVGARVTALARAVQAPAATAELLAAGLPGLTRRVPETVRVADGWAAAIGAVLGPLADAALADDVDAAFSALDASAGMGAVDVVVAAAEEPSPPRAAAGAVAALDVVDAPSGVRRILAPVLLVADRAAARAVWEAAPDAVVVTRAGEIVRDAVLQSPGATPTGLELAAERDAAVAEQLELESALAVVRDEVAAAREALAAARAEREQRVRRARERESAVREAERARASLTARAEAASAEADRLESQVRDAAKALEAARPARDAAAAEIEAGRAEPRPVVDAGLRSGALAALDAAREQTLAARLEVRTLQERITAGRRRRSELEAAADRARAAAQAAERRAADRLAQRLAAEAVLDELPAVQASVDASVEEARARLGELTRRRDVVSGALTGAGRELAAARERAARLEGQGRDLDMRLYEQQVSLAALLERARTEVGLDESRLLEEADPELDREAEERRLRTAERRLAQLGRVNPLALEEFAALEQRHTFLVDQLADLNRTRADLLTIVDELDAKMRTIFEAAYADTEAAFARIFPVLFPGGTGRLTLVSGDGPDSAGVEVAVRPAGKKIERLSLLSGGERSLAAVAFLLAIFTARPSPFYILDEVEAALDDANLGRLLEVIGSLRDASQLILITHQKRTMEIADALYGVSMRQDGVSQVIGQRLGARV
ncbi:MAG TPA: chromosome segregation protein SMC [Amnibacterium sp.]|uniref:chromosome segregation protein SMC n=1 Tax=Amnibacterium sp. TaxID=1872496 RepID=UPI002F9492D8